MKYWKREMNKAISGAVLDLLMFLSFSAFALTESTTGAYIVVSVLLFMASVDAYNNYKCYKTAKHNFEVCKNNQID